MRLVFERISHAIAGITSAEKKQSFVGLNGELWSVFAAKKKCKRHFAYLIALKMSHRPRKPPSFSRSYLHVPRLFACSRIARIVMFFRELSFGS